MGAVSSEDLMADFSYFWAAYPRRQAKRDAEKAWKKLKPDGELVSVMLLAIEAQKRSRQWLDGFVPMPATWIRGERWLDEPAPAAGGRFKMEQPLDVWVCDHTPRCPHRTACWVVSQRKVSA